MHRTDIIAENEKSESGKQLKVLSTLESRNLTSYSARTKCRNNELIPSCDPACHSNNYVSGEPLTKGTPDAKSVEVKQCYETQS